MQNQFTALVKALEKIKQSSDGPGMTRAEMIAGMGWSEASAGRNLRALVHAGIMQPVGRKMHMGIDGVARPTMAYDFVAKAKGRKK